MPAIIGALYLNNGLQICERGPAGVFQDRWYVVFSFADKNAVIFLSAFGGEVFNSKDRGPGDGWVQWKSRCSVEIEIVAERIRKIS